MFVISERLYAHPVDHIRFAAVLFITFIYILLVLFCIIAHMVACFVYFCLIMYKYLLRILIVLYVSFWVFRFIVLFHALLLCVNVYCTTATGFQPNCS